MYWFADALPEWIGIAVGAFADPSFGKPKLSVWERTRHSWVAFDHVLDHFPEGAVSAILPTRQRNSPNALDIKAVLRHGGL